MAATQLIETAPGVQQKLVVGSRQHVDAIQIIRDGHRAGELRAVDEDDCTDVPRDRTDRRNVRTVPVAVARR